MSEELKSVFLTQEVIEARVRAEIGQDSARLDWLENKVLQIEDVTVSSHMDVEGNTAFTLSVGIEGTVHRSLRAAIDAVRQASGDGKNHDKD